MKEIEVVPQFAIKTNRKKRKKPSQIKVYEMAKDEARRFCSETGLHGFQYISKPDNTPIERYVSVLIKQWRIVSLKRKRAITGWGGGLYFFSFPKCAALLLFEKKRTRKNLKQFFLEILNVATFWREKKINSIIFI